MVIPAPLFLVTCVGCPPPSAQPAHQPVEVPQLNSAPVLNAPTLRLAHAESNLATPDVANVVEWSTRSRESNAATVLRRGSQGAVVARLQARLARLGYAVAKIDGDFGPQTQAAVMQFQRANGLVADGVVEASSWAKLNHEITQSGYVPLSQLSSQTSSQPVKSVLSSSIAAPTVPTASVDTASTVSTASKPALAAASSASLFSQKSGWIVILVIIQGTGWLVILQGLNKELLVLTGRSLFPSKTGQWLFNARQ